MNDHPAATFKPELRPLYVQIQGLITKRIADGAWKPGDLLPTEHELAAEYGVSQGTVRKALIALEGEKLIVRRQGVGTYVARHARDTVLFRFFRIVTPEGARLSPKSRLIAQAIRLATAEEARQLSLPEGARLHAVTRVRTLKDAPAIYEFVVVPAAIIPVLDLPATEEMSEEMYVIYQERHGILITRVQERLQAIAAGPEEAQALGVPEGSPLLEIVRVAFDVSGRPVELRISRCDTRENRYSADIVDTDGARG